MNTPGSVPAMTTGERRAGLPDIAIDAARDRKDVEDVVVPLTDGAV
jgi:hypothetical protein